MACGPRPIRCRERPSARARPGSGRRAPGPGDSVGCRTTGTGFMSETDALDRFGGRLVEALCDTQTPEALGELMLFKLGTRLGEVAAPGLGFRAVTFEVVQWSYRQGRTIELA